VDRSARDPTGRIEKYFVHQPPAFLGIHIARDADRNIGRQLVFLAERHSLHNALWNMFNDSLSSQFPCSTNKTAGDL